MIALKHSLLPAAALVGVLIGLAAPAGAQVTSDRIAVLSDYHGYYPCMDCHGDQETITTPRILEEEHFEPLEWEDDQGQTHFVPFGQRVAIADLLVEQDPNTLQSDNLARIGARLNIASYMAQNGLSPADSVWTLVHGGGNLWCLDCHNADDRDKLVKLNGELLSFNDSHLLCGECHGPILRDWDLGIHGKTVGYWNPEQGDEDATVRLLCVECHLPHRPAFSPYQPMPAPVLRVDGPGSHKGKHGADTEQPAHAKETSH